MRTSCHPDRMGWRLRATLSAALLLALLVAGCGVGAGKISVRRSGTSTPTAAASGSPPPTGLGMLHTQGTQVVDSAGHVLLLRGAMIPTSFAYINRWQKGQDPTQILSSVTFEAMASWHMNAVRINISYWIYQLNPTLYMSRLDQAVRAANASGLYVILDYHDDHQSGNPSPDGLMHTESVTFWKIIAAHYAANPMMLFDPINEPKYADWQTWLNGDGSGVVGYQQMIAAIRATGAQQIIVVEPGQGCGCGHSTWQGIGSYLPSDPSIMYSMHDYAEVVRGSPSIWDAGWGPILGHYPIYYGEWAVLPHADHPVFCAGLTSSNADAVTNAFLTYMQSRQANWTAWDFAPYNLIQSFASYAPTTFQSGAPWSCEDPSAAQAGMGMDVMQYLRR